MIRVALREEMEKMETRKRNQARLRLVINNESGGYKSGRKRWRGTPDASSIAKTRSAGIRLAASQPETVPCDLRPKRRAKALCPPTARQASSKASLDMLAINAQTVNHVNANSGNSAPENGWMAKKPTFEPSKLWKRIEEAIGDLPKYQPFNANSLATKIGMSQGSVYRWYRGQGFPELDTALKMSKDGGVCVDWLLNGVKPKHPISADPILRELFEISEDLREEGRKSVLRAAKGELLQQQADDIKASDASKKRA